MRFAAGLLVAVYFVALGSLALYGLHRLFLAVTCLRRRRSPAAPPSDLPVVTVQLPVFNEMYVLDRLVEAACRLRHPRRLLEIQILDDSTDATTARARELARLWSERGFDVSCLHRKERDGFKAGALAAGLEKARGEFIAIFDADFIPPPDFLERTLPCFTDPKAGMVQARWGHLNRDYSMLTRAQALMLDGHFVVEQGARAASGRFFNFNGTAGVFRRRCIEEAGGWRPDTLTEDLDLSYRAQMAGWRFVFLEDLVCPAELPVELNSLRSQQHRWAKGSIQTALRILPGILRSRLSPRVKAEAFFHLTNNAAYLLLFLVSLLVIPSLVLRHEIGWHVPLLDLGLFAAGTGSFAIFCAASQWPRRRGLLRALAEVPVVMMLGAGLALNNSLAVIEALAGIPSAFRRTPKFRIGGASAAGAKAGRRWQDLAYRGEASRLAVAEWILALILGGGIAWAVRQGVYASVPFLALFASGYGYVAILSVAQDLSVHLHRRRPAAESAA